MDLATHSAQLERWIGREALEAISKSMLDWYGPPIAMAGVPGDVWAHKGGDFRGRIQAGAEATARDVIAGRAAQALRWARRTSRRFGQDQATQLNAGFASLSALISAATTGGGKQDLAWSKTGPTVVVGQTAQLWQVAGFPAAGAAGGAAPGGTVPTSATAGALPFNNVPGASGQFNCLASAFTTASAINSLLLYDRLFSVAKTMNSTATEAVTGVPTRYTNTTAGNMDSIAGNFCFPVVGLTALAATAHNWTVCQYTNQAGTAAQSFPSTAGISGGIIHELDLPIGTWRLPLASGDTGVKALTQMQCSALVATGLVDFVVGHPLAFMPIPLANMICNYDGINTAFNLVRIFDNACISWLQLSPPAVTATNFGGSISIVAG